MIRAILVDDEYLARQRVFKLLESHEEIKVVGEAKNGSQAVEMINLKEPDLVFLDVQMPDFDGFEVVKRINSKKLPYIVFTTAYDRYAIQAFDVHALDYLLKPIDEDRFDESLQKVLKHFEVLRTSDFNKKLMRMVRNFVRPAQDYISEIAIVDKGLEHQVALEDVLYIEANGNYLNLQTTEKTYLYRTTMNALVAELNPDDFLRIHRSVIVNLRYIKKCTYQTNSEYKFTMKDGKIVLSGRSFKSGIVQYLSNL